MKERERGLFRGRARPADEAHEVKAILRDASRADPDTLSDIVNELRTHGGNLRTQVEIDGVIARFRATHAEKHRKDEGR